LTCTCKIVYYTDCDASLREKLNAFKEFIENSFEGVFLIKVWDEGSIVGLFKVK
jgi:hypothetical protein